MGTDTTNSAAWNKDLRKENVLWKAQQYSVVILESVFDYYAPLQVFLDQ